MMHLIESFGCGLAFAFGAVCGVMICVMFQKSDRDKIAKEIRDSNKRVEERVGVYVATMATCLQHIELQSAPPAKKNSENSVNPV